MNEELFASYLNIYMIKPGYCMYSNTHTCISVSRVADIVAALLPIRYHVATSIYITMPV